MLKGGAREPLARTSESLSSLFSLSYFRLDFFPWETGASCLSRSLYTTSNRSIDEPIQIQRSINSRTSPWLSWTPIETSSIHPFLFNAPSKPTLCTENGRWYTESHWQEYARKGSASSKASDLTYFGIVQEVNIERESFLIRSIQLGYDYINSLPCI